MALLALHGNRQGHFIHILSNSRNIVLHIGFHTLSSSRAEARAWAAVHSWQLPKQLLHDWEERPASPPEVALFSTCQRTRSNCEWKLAQTLTKHSPTSCDSTRHAPTHSHNDHLNPPKGHLSFENTSLMCRECILIFLSCSKPSNISLRSTVLDISSGFDNSLLSRNWI